MDFRKAVGIERPMRRISGSFRRGLLTLGMGLGALCPQADVTAQVVQGVVLDASDTTPLAGVMVVVLDLTGAVAGRALTGAEGLFEIRVSHPGRYQARVDRIGYESITTPAFDASPEGTYQRILVPIRAIQLAGLDVSGARRCEVRAEVGHATAEVWAEARKALEATQWASETQRYDYTLLQFTRRWDADGRRVLDERRDFLERRGQAPYTSVPAERLLERGFAREVFGAYLSYYAPDAAVLLSDAFLDTHCMRARKTENGMVALEFEPIRGRDIPEVKGTMWLDALTAELRWVEYRYLNLDRGRAVGEAGGELEFARLEGGAWIVADWHVRMPLLEPGRAVGYRRTGYEDKGGTVWRAENSSGKQVYKAVTGHIKGLVLDSLGAPLRGVVLVPRGIEARAESASDGTFVLADLPEGLIRIDIVAPHLDTLGLNAFDTALVSVLSKGEIGEMNVKVPGVTDRLRSACGGRRPAGTSILLGRVRDTEGSAERVTVRVARRSGSGRFRVQEQATPPGQAPASRWEQVDNTPWWEARLDDRALFILCDVPYPSVVQVEADLGGRVAKTDITVETGASVTVVTVLIPPAAQPH